MPNTDNISAKRTGTKSYFSGEWSHIFDGSRRDTNCRIVIDSDKNELILMTIAKGAGFRLPSKLEFADLADSLKNANAEVFDSPEDYGLTRTKKLPDWAQIKTA